MSQETDTIEAQLTHERAGQRGETERKTHGQQGKGKSAWLTIGVVWCIAHNGRRNNDVTTRDNDRIGWRRAQIAKSPGTEGGGREREKKTRYNNATWDGYSAFVACRQEVGSRTVLWCVWLFFAGRRARRDQQVQSMNRPPFFQLFEIAEQVHRIVIVSSKRRSPAVWLKNRQSADWVRKA